MNRRTIGLLAVLFAFFFALASCRLLVWYGQSRRSRQEFDQVAALLGQWQQLEQPTGEEPPILEQYAAVYAANPDFVGWVSIDGTNIDYPVMQSPEDPDFYLRHNFEKQESNYGVPYLQADCDVLQSDNLVIYGHNMNDSSMFSDLCKYKDPAFYQNHKTIRFDSKYSCGTYEILAVVQTTANDKEFAYNRFVHAQREQDFTDYITTCKNLSLYPTEASAEYGDRLITLSTCEFSQTNGRVVIVAKLIAETA